MSAPLILLIFLVLISLLIIFVAIFFRPRAKTITNQQIEEYLQVLEKRSGFSRPVRVPDQRGNCLIYTFPGQVTQSTSVVNGLTPASISSVIDCYDEDQDFLRKVFSTCTRSDYCISPDGNLVSPGERIELYQHCIATVLPCFRYNESFLASLSVNGQCLTLGDPLSVQPCNLFDKNTVLRVTRALPISLTGNSNGPFARLFNRATGKCIVPSSLTPRSGDPLIEGSCDPNSGYVWWVIPELTLTRSVGGQIETFTAPPQLVYTPSVGTPPNNLTDYFSNPNNGALSIQISNGRMVLLPYSTNSNARTELLKYSLEI